MGIIKYISTFILCEQTWKSIYLTLTQLKRLLSISSRDKSSHQTLSSWMSNAQCATPSQLYTPTHKELFFAETASISCAYQKAEKESSVSDPPGEERATEHIEMPY